MQHFDFLALGMILMCVCLQVRAEITSKEKEEEDLIEKVQKEVKYVCLVSLSLCICLSLFLPFSVPLSKIGRAHV